MKRRSMASSSRCFLVLIAIALAPFAVARQNPSDKEASSTTDLTQKDGLYEPLGLHLPVPLPPFPDLCSKLKKPGTAEGTDEYEPSGLDKIGKIFCPPPPAPVPSPPPTPSSPVPTPSPAPAPAPTITIPKPCLKKLGFAGGTAEYETSGLDKIDNIFCPPPPAPVPSTVPTPAPTPTSPAPTPTSPAPTPSSPVPTPSPAPVPALTA